MTVRSSEGGMQVSRMSRFAAASVSLMSLAAVVWCAVGSAAAPAAGEILRRMDENLSFKTVYYEASVETVVAGRTNTKSMRAWVEGDSRALVEFTNQRDAGTAILKIGDDLWLFSPTADEAVKLSGPLLRQSMMGSDLSFDEALESKSILGLYDARVVGDEVVDGRRCYVLELVAREGAEVSYHRRRVWVDCERYISLLEESYAPSGKLLKRSRTERVQRFGQRYYPVSVVVEDTTRKGSSTRFVVETIVFDGPIPAHTFTMERLTGRL